MAKYKKKRARELEHDKFRDTAGKLFDRLGDALEGKGKQLLYGILAIAVVGALIGFWLNWSHRKSDEARRALGRAIEITSTPITGASLVPPTGPSFSNEQDRARKAIEEFEKVAAKYGDPYQTEARYFIATNMMTIDREKAMQQLAEVGKSNVKEPAALANFALGQAKESDGKLDEAAQIYQQLASQNSMVVTADTANFRLASVYEKQGKKKEAVEILFNMVEAARKAKDVDGTSLPSNQAARAAADKLQTLDPDRYAKLTPEAPSGDSPF